jgi:cytochrome c oxidase cbb3-type subunit 4
MDTSHYDTLRHFADSWGLLYMVAIFVAVMVIVMLPGSKQRAAEAARIPLEDKDEERRP